MDYEAVIGLEVHVQLRTRSKIFCSCSTKFGAPPNNHTCPVCLGMPGVLPVVNRQVIEYALKMALATNCRIPAWNRFARKHYFYPDLPKGYQISQYEFPLAEHGWITVGTNGQSRRIGITRIHLEDDAGKLVHDESRPLSYVDLNRTGTPLIEIVSEPDMHTPEEAAEYLRKIRQIVRYLEISDGNMEQGSLRCDANISLRPRGQEKFGVKSELKNMNSFRNVQKALEYEIRRHAALLQDGQEIIQETRLWDTAREVTLPMRGKEKAHDYRYFPDPDLLPTAIDENWVNRIKSEMPELPAQKCDRFREQYGLPPYDAGVLTDSRGLAEYFEKTAAIFPEPKTVSNWIMVEIIRLLKQDEREIESCPVSPEKLAELLKLVKDQVISSTTAKEVLQDAYSSGISPGKIVKEKGLIQVSDESTLSTVIEKVLKDHPAEVEKYRSGTRKVLGFLMGRVMKETQGRANPKKVNAMLLKALE